MRYDADYEGTQIHSPHFAAYLKELADRWASYLSLENGRVIEVGCGQGEFLAALSKATDARLVGYDPAARTAKAGRARLIADILPPAGKGRDKKDAMADVVFSRMTLEHVEDPLTFTMRQKAWLCDRKRGFHQAEYWVRRFQMLQQPSSKPGHANYSTSTSTTFPRGRCQNYSIVPASTSYMGKPTIHISLQNPKVLM